MERTYYTLSLGPWDAWALWGQWPHLLILFVWEFCDGMFRYCDDNTYIIVIVTYGSYTWSYGVRFVVPWDDFGLHCGLAITVVERLQRYNCIWLTYIENVEQNVLPQCRRFEAVRCYLYVESWFGNGTLCSSYVWDFNSSKGALC